MHFFLGITEQARLEGISEDHLIQPCVGKGAWIRLSNTGKSPYLEKLSRWGLCHVLGEVVPAIDYSHCTKNVFLVSK